MGSLPHPNSRPRRAVLTTDKDMFGRVLNYGSVPAAIDWYSIDFYAEDSQMWTYPQNVLYPSYVFPRLSTAQCALVVPGAYAGTDQPISWYISFNQQTATAFLNWARNNPKVIGINPWYFSHEPGLGPRNSIAAGDNAQLASIWNTMGKSILAK